MIDMKKIDKLIDLIRCKNWTAAHAMLDEEELADPGEATIAHWRSVALRDEGRYEDALQNLADNFHLFECKTGVFHKRAELFKKMGDDSAALAELQKAPFDTEIEDHEALVVDAKFFQFYLMLEAGLPVTPEQWSEIPDDYISLLPTGERVTKRQLIQISNGA